MTKHSTDTMSICVPNVINCGCAKCARSSFATCGAGRDLLCGRGVRLWVETRLKTILRGRRDFVSLTAKNFYLATSLATVSTVRTIRSRYSLRDSALLSRRIYLVSTLRGRPAACGATGYAPAAGAAVPNTAIRPVLLSIGTYSEHSDLQACSVVARERHCIL